MKSQLESIIRGYNKQKRPDITAKLLGIEKNIITVRLSGMRPDSFLDDFKNSVEEKTQSRLFVEKIKKDDGNRIVKFSIREERGPADDILDVLSKYYEGAPAPKQGHED
ncbi:MAG: hypothetical protein HYU56_02725 [Candidatus Aenigmarchaeota archaeon]|nr:hypothetical protein [Candidatus Aenigmarchaeota archaeon]